MAAGVTSRRSRQRQPFSADSIWNRPVGAGAALSYAAIVPATQRSPHGWPEVTCDPENIGSGWADDVQVTITGPDRTVTGWMNPAVAGHANGVMNNSAAVLSTDGVTWHSGQPLDWPGGATADSQYGFKTTQDTNVHGAGIVGSHGGSGLSTVGGSIRLVPTPRGRVSELDLPGPIRHALKVNLDNANLDASTGGGAGFVWPAIRADSGFDAATNNEYRSTNGVGMGTLLTLAEAPDAAVYTDPRAFKIARAIFEFGAYVVDCTARPVYAICCEHDALPFAPWGAPAEDQALHAQLMTMFGALHRVTNNAPGPVAGGGRPRAAIPYPLEV